MHHREGKRTFALEFTSSSDETADDIPSSKVVRTDHPLTELSSDYDLSDGAPAAQHEPHAKKPEPEGLDDEFHPVIAEETERTEEEQAEESESEDPYKVFYCIRTKRLAPFRSHLTFVFKLEQREIMYAKTKGVLSDAIYISSNPDINVKAGNYDYVMKTARGKNKFALYGKNSETSELSLTFTNDYGKEQLGPRKIAMAFGERMLHSRIPKRTKDGRWVMTFNGKYVLKSQKNAILLNENEKPVVIVRKIQKSSLEIEVIQDFVYVHLFALGISSFLCPM